MNLSGKVALVTGSGRGIGQAIALKLAGAGADIVLNDIAAAVDALQMTTNEIKVFNRKVLAVPADVSSSEDVNKMVDKAIEVMGHIDILVNNAGVTRDQLVMRMSDEEWNTVLNIDLKSVFLCSRAVLRPMLKQKSGRIVSIASVVGITGNFGQANYSSAKAGVIAFTKSLAKEVGSRGITVNAVAPGFIETKMTEKLDEVHKKAYMDRIPLGTAGTPRDVAEAVAFLASDEARYITGQTLNVDGGLALG
ncbi:MAG TPA: 3-oxoacyl-[acyl-carrier-protein] reductase [Dehalococcoidales bacterium]|nr:3-oxoacyl-[acyl-carrier-protein] reductase [Dehalococcoidales bacterium]